MAQAFVTTYKNCYRYSPEHRVPPIRPEKDYKVCYGKEEDWYKTETYDNKNIDFHKIELAVRNLGIRRMSSSTYRVDYCRDWRPPEIGVDLDKPKEEGEFQLLDTFKPTYKKNTEEMQLIPTLQTSRNLLGFLTKSEMYIPMSTFQHYHGRLGFELLEKAQQRAKAKKVA